MYIPPLKTGYRTLLKMEYCTENRAFQLKTPVQKMSYKM
jgi:hypothetical protein